jgi:Ca2+-binding EF-hand superfamily protein
MYIGSQSLFSLIKAFKDIDKDNNRLVSLSEFKYVMKDMNMGLQDLELRLVLNHYDIIG